MKETLNLEKILDAYSIIHDEFLDMMQFMPSISISFQSGSDSGIIGLFSIGNFPSLTIEYIRRGRIRIIHSQPIIAGIRIGKLIFWQEYASEINPDNYTYDDIVEILRTFYNMILEYKTGIGGEILRACCLKIIATDEENRDKLNISFEIRVYLHSGMSFFIPDVSTKTLSSQMSLYESFDISRDDGIMNITDKYGIGVPLELTQENLDAYSRSAIKLQ